MFKNKKLFFIIVNYNCFPYILDCLKSIRELNVPLGFRKRVVVVDNNSKDASLEEIKDLFGTIKIIKNKKNLGFASASNIGIQFSLKQGADFVFLINPDTVIDKNALKYLIKVFKKENSGIAVPLLKSRDEEGRVFYALGKNFNRVLGRTKHKHVRNIPVGIREEKMVSGCAMLVKRRVFEKIGMFDKRFFLYFEDSDFCLRAEQAGFKIYLYPKAVVEHKISASVGKEKIKYLFWSNLLFVLKWVKPWFWPFSFLYLVILNLKSRLFYNKKVNKIRAIWKI